MSKPFPIRPGVTYSFTRRCVGRHRWLTPSKQLNELELYLFAVGMQRYEIEAHALVFMSTHNHGVVTDVKGRMPAFEQWFNSLMGRATNVLIGRSDTFWGLRGKDRRIIVDGAAAINALVYAFNNPTKAGLVRHGRDWPGVRSTPQSMLGATHGQSITVKRPGFFFDPDGEMPEEVTLTFSVPKVLLDEAERDEAIRGQGRGGVENEAADARKKRLAGKVVGVIGRELHEAELEVAEEMREAGRRFVGRRAILKQDRDRRSSTPEKRRADGAPVPIFMASSAKVTRELLEGLWDWRARYQEARLALLALEHGVAGGECSGAQVVLPVFPEGTYQLRLIANVPCHPPPD